ncbi:hypothetical protein ACTFIU_007308 [Dictyostelium citrinum]
MGNINPSAPFYHLSATSIHKNCHQAWLKLKTPPNKPSHYNHLPKLKRVYNDLMVLQYPEFNAFSPTPGKDLLWRFVLKALPKVYNTICSHCNVRESAEHIFFKCKSHLQTTQLILDHIQNKIGGQKIIWNIKILNHLDIAITANTIALLFEYISRKRNKFNELKKPKKHKQWNTPLNTIQLPKQLSQYKTTLNTLFL